VLQLIGIIEHRNGTVVATARSTLKARGLIGWLWGEVVSTVVYVLNRCPTKSVDDMTPFEAWHGKKLAMHHLRMFGCIVCIQNMTPYLKKLEDRGCKMIYIGYNSGSKTYRAFDPITKCVHVTRDVGFDEQVQWDWGTGDDNSEPGGGDDVFMVVYTTISQAAAETEGVDEELTEQSSLPTTDVDTEVDNDINDGNLDVIHDDVEVDDDVDDDNLDINHDDDTSLNFSNINGILGMVGFSPHTLVAEELHVVSSNEPASFAEAEHSPSWRKVMMEEMMWIEENDT
jgi:hypothetical protein